MFSCMWIWKTLSSTSPPHSTGCLVLSGNTRKKYNKTLNLFQDLLHTYIICGDLLYLVGHLGDLYIAPGADVPLWNE
jgi:hypothetical protein